MCNKAILENGGTLESVRDRYKTHEMCDKAADNYVHALEFVPDCYKINKMCNKAVNTYPSTILQYNLFLNAIRLTKCVAKLLIFVFLNLILFLIDIKFKKFLTI